MHTSSTHLTATLILSHYCPLLFSRYLSMLEYTVGTQMRVLMQARICTLNASMRENPSGKAEQGCQHTTLMAVLARVLIVIGRRQDRSCTKSYIRDAPKASATLLLGGFATSFAPWRWSYRPCSRSRTAARPPCSDCEPTGSAFPLPCFVSIPDRTSRRTATRGRASPLYPPP